MRTFALALVVVVAGIGPAHGQKAVSAPAAPQAAVAAAAQAATPPLTPSQQEEFLREAKIVRTKSVTKGVTGTVRATLSDGTTTNDASLQMVDVSAARFETNRGTELNFRDFWGYNVAAYRLGVMLGLDMIPPSVARRYKGKEAAYTWWIDNVLMDEQGRIDSNMSPPDSQYWRAQNDIVRVFDQLIANTDRNQGNVLIDKQWKIWMIDHSRAFRRSEDLRNPTAIVRCEKTLFEKLRMLDAASLKAQLNDYLSQYEMNALLKRRDVIVARVEALGPTAFYELKRPRATPASTTK